MPPQNHQKSSFRKRWKKTSKRKKILAISIILILVFVIFIAPRPVTLIVSNQSFDEPYINITVKVNGVVILSDELYVANEHNWTDHSVFLWGIFQFIEVKNDNARRTDTAVVSTVTGGYILIQYWNSDSKEHFTVDYSLEHPVFM